MHSISQHWPNESTTNCSTTKLCLHFH